MRGRISWSLAVRSPAPPIPSRPSGKSRPILAISSLRARNLDLPRSDGDKPPMGVMVKICGINSREAADAALRAGADFAGLVFFERSPRHLSLDQAAVLAQLLHGRTRVVTLLVEPSDAVVDEVLAAVSPDLIQLHGNESPARVAAIASRSGRPIIKVLAVAD